MLGQAPSIFESPRPNPVGFLTKLHVDLPLLTGLILLSVFGLVVLFSASGQDLSQVNKQVWRFALAYGVMLFLAQVPPSKLHRFTPWLYGATLLMLAAVTLFGVIGKGAQRWLDIGFIRFQPSEFAKLTVPLMISWLLSAKPLPPRWPRVMIAGLVFLLPAVLIAEQPDLGTALLVASAGVFALFLAGMSWRLIGLLGFLAAAAMPLLWFSMRTYQRQRIFTLLSPEQDPLGTGYHIIQSKIAIGSGGLYGKGWLYGTQSHLEFLPESSTDFIFAVLGEELGLIGILLLLGLYLFVILRGLYIATQAQDSFARLLAGSLTLVFFVYIFVNTGMVSGILPVVGVPLPLISYGGTSLVTIMAGFGILMSIHTHRKLLPT